MKIALNQGTNANAWQVCGSIPAPAALLRFSPHLFFLLLSGSDFVKLESET
jgi:hypothetical protein